MPKVLRTIWEIAKLALPFIINRKRNSDSIDPSIKKSILRMRKEARAKFKAKK